MATDIEIVEPDDLAYAAFSANFTDYNAAHSTWNAQSFSCVIRDGSRIVAGGRGIVNMGALEIRGIWLDPGLRGLGVGARLLAAIEDEARARGARRAMLFTFSWQAEGFYRRMGYTEFSRFRFPDGPERIDMQKEL